MKGESFQPVSPVMKRPVLFKVGDFMLVPVQTKRQRKPWLQGMMRMNTWTKELNNQAGSWFKRHQKQILNSKTACMRQRNIEAKGGVKLVLISKFFARHIQRRKYQTH
jgi:hypothetical protein